MKIEDRLKRLQKELKRLRPDQGRLARKNGRAAVLAQLRALREDVDREFPVIKKDKSAPRKKGLTGMSALARKNELCRRARKAGYVPLSATSALGTWHADYAARLFRQHKIPCRLIPGGQIGGTVEWWPAWAVYADNAAELKRAKKSPKLQKRIVVRAKLRG